MSGYMCLHMAPFWIDIMLLELVYFSYFFSFYQPRGLFTIAFDEEGEATAVAVVPTFGRAVLGSKLVDGRCWVQFPVELVNLAVRSLPRFFPKLT